jgi:hypothetical protein
MSNILGTFCVKNLENKHFELSSEKDTFVKKESDFIPKRKKMHATI